MLQLLLCDGSHTLKCSMLPDGCRWQQRSSPNRHTVPTGQGRKAGDSQAAGKKLRRELHRTDTKNRQECNILGGLWVMRDKCTR